MTILALKTDQAVAEVWLLEDGQELANLKWPAHQKLAETLNSKIDEILSRSSKNISDLQGIVCYKGPGSFTGLRISMSVANAMAYALKIPIVATTGGNWLQNSLHKIANQQADKIALPEYGRPAHVTKPKK